MNEGVFGIIAGSGRYPFEMVQGARAAGVPRIFVAAFEHETDPALAALADDIEWLRVGQLGRLLAAFSQRGIRHAVMAGQIAPKNLFDLRPDLRALLLLGRLQTRNAETIFGAIADELAAVGTTLVDARTFLEDALAPAGVFAGPRLPRRAERDVAFGLRIARETSRLDIGQTVVVKNGTVLAVEAFEGTNAAIQRGGALGHAGSVVVKVSKPGQDFRFDVPVIGPITLETAAAAHIRVLAVEAGCTLCLERERVQELALRHGVSVTGVSA